MSESSNTRNLDQLVPQTLSITSEQLQEYVEKKKCLKACEACGSDKWDGSAIDGKPGLFTIASARDTSYASWMFQFNCQTCGNTRFIGAGYVWSYFFDRKGLLS